MVADEIFLQTCHRIRGTFYNCWQGLDQGNTNAATNLSAMFLLFPMVEMMKMVDEGVQLGKEHFAGELEVLTRMDGENVLHG